jgi:hypothetical protein
MNQKNENQAQPQMYASLNEGVKSTKYGRQTLKNSQHNAHYGGYLLLPRPGGPKVCPRIGFHQYAAYLFSRARSLILKSRLSQPSF